MNQSYGVAINLAKTLIFLSVFIHNGLSAAPSIIQECSWMLFSKKCAGQPRQENIYWQDKYLEEFQDIDILMPAKNTVNKNNICNSDYRVDYHADHISGDFEKVSRTGNMIKSQGFSLSIDKFGLPSEIAINGRDLLSSPIKLAGIDSLLGKEKAESSTLWLSDGNEISWETRVENDRLLYINNSRLGYDRFIQSNITIVPKYKLLIDSLGISIRVKTQQYMYLATSNDVTGISLSNGKLHRVPPGHSVTPFPNKLQALPFSNIVEILGNDSGIYLAFESDKYWQQKNGDAFVISQKDMDSEIKAEFVNYKPDYISAPIEFKFAIGVLPVRTNRQWQQLSQYNPAQLKDINSVYNAKASRSFRAAANDKDFSYKGKLSALKSAAEEGLRTVVVHQGWTDLQGYPGSKDVSVLNQLKSLVEEAHRLNIKVLAYVGQELSIDAPEWQTHAKEFTSIPVIPGRKRGNVYAIRPNSGNSCYAEFLVRKIKELAEHTGIDGLFLDLIPDTDLDANMPANHGYVDKEGTLRGERSLFITREMMKAIYEIFHGGIVEDGLVVGHVRNLFYPAHAFVDYLLVGEDQIKMLRNNSMVPLADVYSVDMLRTVANSQISGVPLFWLTKEDRGSPSIVQNRSILLPHGILQRTQWPQFIGRNSPRTMFNDTQEVLEEWVIWQELSRLGSDNIVFFPYWNNSQYFLDNTLENSLISFWHSDHELLMIIANPNNFAVSGKFKLDLKSLKFNNSKLKFKDVITSFYYRPDVNNEISLSLNPKSSIVLKVENGS